MNNPDEVIQYVRFGISRLTPENGQHTFEHICRKFSLGRICLNILPATGPVQAGGDQGRDFETFHTYLKLSPLNERFFVGFAENTLVFACSLEKDPAVKNGKIMSDVATIMAKGETVERIYFFSSHDIPVAKRHALQNWTQETYNVKLEIVDGNTLAEQLAQPDLFWIANKYLNVPSEMYPRPYDAADWYEEMRLKYYSLVDFPLTFEAFQDIKIALRYIYKDKYLKVDLPFWLSKMQRFNIDEHFKTLRKKAIYEIYVATLIGLGNVEGLEEDIRFYFSDLSEISTESEFEDATCLVSFIHTATHNGKTAFITKEVENWKGELINLTDTEQKISFGDPNRFCIISSVKAMQFFSGVRGNFEDPNSFQQGLTGALKEYNKILPILPEAPFYPLENLSNNLTKYIKTLLQVGIVSEGMEEFAGKIDELLGIRVGDITVAEKLRDRALAYLESDNEIMAIKRLHEAKLRWLKAETLKPTVLTLTLLAESYQKLRMSFAAKYCAMAAAHLILRSEDYELYKYLPKTVDKLADNDYITGAWVNYLDLLEFLFPATNAIRGSEDLYEDEDYKIWIFYAAIILYFTRRFYPVVSHLVENKVRRLKWFGEEIFETAGMVEERYGKFSEDQCWESFERDLSFKPFNDLGKLREIEFYAYGLRWKFHFLNDYHTNAVAEQLISTLQILLVELADVDLHLLRADVEIELATTENGEMRFEKLPSNEKYLWKFTLPICQTTDFETVSSQSGQYASFTFAALQELSLLPTKEFVNIAEKTFNKGELSSKLTFVKMYEHFYREFYNQERFEETQRQHFIAPFQSKNFAEKSHPILSWRNTLSSRYNSNESEKLIIRRYQNSMPPLEITLPTLLVNTSFQETVVKLRSEGWLDWQTLMASANLAVSERFRYRYGNNHAQFQKEMFEMFKMPEKELITPLPAALFSIENLRSQLRVMLVMVLPSFKLENFSQTPKLEAIREFLNLRFRLDKDDIPNESPFRF